MEGLSATPRKKPSEEKEWGKQGGKSKQREKGEKNKYRKEYDTEKKEKRIEESQIGRILKLSSLSGSQFPSQFMSNFRVSSCFF